jgi:hypothetical protein
MEIAGYAVCEITLSGPHGECRNADNVVVDGASNIRIVSCNFQKAVTARLPTSTGGAALSILVASNTFLGAFTVEGMPGGGTPISLNASVAASTFYTNETLRQLSIASGSAISLDSLQALTTSIRIMDLAWTGATVVLTKLNMFGTHPFPRVVVSNCTFDTVSSLRILGGTFRVPNPLQMSTILVADSSFTEKSMLQLSGLHILSDQGYNDGQGVILSGSTVFRSGSTLHCNTTAGLLTKSASAPVLQIPYSVTFDRSTLNVSLLASVGAFSITPTVSNIMSGSPTTMIVTLQGHTGTAITISSIPEEGTPSRFINLQLNVVASALGILTASSMTLVATSVVAIVRGTTLDALVLCNVIGTSITFTVDALTILTPSYSLHRLEIASCIFNASSLAIANSAFRVPSPAYRAVLFIQNTTFASETLIAFKGNTIVSDQDYNDGGGVWFGSGLGFTNSNFEISGGTLQLRNKSSWLIRFNATDAPTWKESNFTASLAGSVGSLGITPPPCSEFRHFYLNLANNSAMSTLTVSDVRVTGPSSFQLSITASTVNSIAFSKLRFHSPFQAISIGPATTFDTLLITQSTFADASNISVLSPSVVSTVYDTARIRVSQVSFTNAGCLIVAGTYRVPSVRGSATLLFENVTAVDANVSINGVTLISEAYNDARGIVIHPSCCFLRSILNVSDSS